MEESEGWSRKDHLFIENLKTMTAEEAAVAAGYSRKYASRKLYHMRQKYRAARQIANVYENWRKHPRIDKLLSDGRIQTET